MPNKNRGGEQATPKIVVHLQCADSGNPFSYAGLGEPSDFRILARFFPDRGLGWKLALGGGVWRI